MRLAPLSVCLFVSVMLFTSCGLFRSHTHDQVRDAETFVVKVRTDPADGAPEGIAFMGAGAALAAAAIGEVVSFASSQVQRHLERVAELHEASYSGSAVAQIRAGSTWTIELERHARIGGAGDDPEAVMRAEYALEAFEVDGGLALVLRPRSLQMSHAAARLANAKRSLDVELSFDFATPGVASGEDAELVRKVLGDTLVHRTRAQLAALPDSTRSFEPSSAVGFVAMPTTRPEELHLLALTVGVVERDPSRAADRNRAAAESLESLAPLLEAYVKERLATKEPERR